MQDDETSKLRILRAFSINKREDVPNEDVWRVSDDGTKVAISDGASVSYDPAPWAQALASRFVDNPDVSREWLKTAVDAYDAAYDRDALPWMQQAAFDRGSFATLLGVILQSSHTAIRALAIGDSILAIIDNGEVVRTLPYQRPEEFERAPQLLSTAVIENRQFDDETLSKAWHDVSLKGLIQPVLLLLTDAIGRWLLDDPSSQRVALLLALNSEVAFSDFVIAEREQGRLRRDDTTMVVIGEAP